MAIVCNSKATGDGLTFIGRFTIHCDVCGQEIRGGDGNIETDLVEDSPIRFVCLDCEATLKHRGDVWMQIVRVTHGHGKFIIETR